MNQFDEDDFYDEEAYSGDEQEFVEEDLTAEEASQLYSQLPALKSAFTDYNNPLITEGVLKQTLWYNYYDLLASIKEIKSNYKKLVPPNGKLMWVYFDAFIPTLVLVTDSRSSDIVHSYNSLCWVL